MNFGLNSMVEDKNRKGRGELFILAAFVVVLSAIVMSQTELRLNFLADDAFYVTLPAKHYVNSGEFPSLDGVNPTNGFHPMIFFIDVIFAKLGIQDIYLANMIIGVGFLLLTVWLFFHYVRKFLSESTTMWLSAALLVNPFLIASALSGLESTLFTAAIVVYYVRLYDLVNGWCQGKKQEWQAWLIQGLLGVLCYLCRTEFLFHMLGHALAYFILWGIGLRARRVRDCFQSLVPWLLLVVPPTVTFYFYGLWGHSITGHFTQSSASQKSVIHEIAAGNFSAINPGRFFEGFQDHGLLGVLLLLGPVILCIQQFRKVRPGLLFIVCSTFSILFFYSLLIPIYQWHYMASYVLMLSIALPFIFKDGDRNVAISPIYAGYLLVAVLGLVAWVRFSNPGDFYQFRNLDLVYGIVYLGAWLFLVRSKPFLERQAMALTIAGILACCSMLWFGKSFRKVHYYRYELSHQLIEWIPKDVKVGVAAAGIYAKFLDPDTNKRVVNLDGAISWPTLLALREDRVPEFIDEQGIDVLLEAKPLPGFQSIENSFGIQVRKTKPDLIRILQEKFPDLEEDGDL